MNQLLKYSFSIMLVCFIGFVGHISILYFLKLPLLENEIIAAYIGNSALAIAIVVALLKAPLRFQNSLGFLFLLGSFFKFGFFFLFFYSGFKDDGVISRTEFFAFFTPYALALFMEAKCLINKLSK